MKLLARRVEKPWGRDALPAVFGPPDGRRIGEIWFEPPENEPLPLLAKYLFTSDRLSVQVHPSGNAGQGQATSRAKSECWYVVEADEGASIGVGLRQPLSADEARQAALDGSIEAQLAWRSVKAGDFIYVPAGTVHSIGAGLTMLEVQQNCDVTYRLFDFGRPRSLQLDEALAVANLSPADPAHFRAADGSGDQILISVAPFTVARVSSEEGAAWMHDRLRWILPIAGSAEIAGDVATVGECLLAAPGVRLGLSADATVLVAADGPSEA